MSLNFHSFPGPPADPHEDIFRLCFTKLSLSVLHFVLHSSTREQEECQMKHKLCNYRSEPFLCFPSLYRYSATGDPFISPAFNWSIFPFQKDILYCSFDSCGHRLALHMYSGGRLWSNIWWWSVCQLRFGERNGGKTSCMFLPTPACLGRTNLHPTPVDTLVVVAAGILHNSLLALNYSCWMRLRTQGDACLQSATWEETELQGEACDVRRECFNTFFTPPQGSVSGIAKWCEGTSFWVRTAKSSDSYGYSVCFLELCVELFVIEKCLIRKKHFWLLLVSPLPLLWPLPPHLHKQTLFTLYT